MISVYVFLNIHIISQCEDSRTFKEIDGGVKKGDVSSGYGFMNIHNNLQQNGLRSLMDYNDINDTYIMLLYRMDM